MKALMLNVLVYLSRRQKKNGVLLLGICESGKTALFSKLVYGGMSQTYASIKENVGDYQTSGKKPRHLKLVDLPGHEKLRHQFLKQYKAKAGGIVYVVDSQAIQREIKDVAEFLYTFLTDTSVLKSGIRILIACNKQDHTMAKGSKVVRGLLEKELNTLRVTRAGALEGLDTNDTKNISPLGRPDKEFQFIDLRVPVDFVECSVRENLDPVKVWLDKL